MLLMPINIRIQVKNGRKLRSGRHEGLFSEPPLLAQFRHPMRSIYFDEELEVRIQIFGLKPTSEMSSRRSSWC